MLVVNVRPAVREDQHLIAGLIQTAPYVHRHLDWRNPLDWIGTPPYFVLEAQGRIAAVMGCPPDPPGVAWLRLFAACEEIDLPQSWRSLWEMTQKYLAWTGGALVAAIALFEWQEDLLAASGFACSQSIVMLERMASQPEAPAPAGNGELSLRAMRHYDLPAVEAVDKAAFVPLWRNSLDTLTRAFPQAVLATVAEHSGRVVGYQISTRTPFGAHLARLAVAPEAQGRGVGRQLLSDVIQQAGEQGMSRLTVNTQNDNAASLALYQNAGFTLTGERYPVFQFQVS